MDDLQIYEGQATTGVDEPEAVAPVAMPILLGNFPNPFHPATAIQFDLAQAAPVTLRIFDAAGRAVRVLVDRRLPAGRQSVSWDGRNQDAVPMASGVYYYRIEGAGFSESRSMVLAK